MYVNIDDENEIIIVSKEDLYDMDVIMSQMIHPMLIKFRELAETSYKYPADISNEDLPERLHLPTGCSSNRKQWLYILDNMIYAHMVIMNREPITVEMQKEIDEGLRLFGKYYQALWHWVVNCGNNLPLDGNNLPLDGNNLPMIK